MKKFFSLLILIDFCCLMIYSQDNNYWANAKPGITKVFAILFTDEQNGTAISGEGDVLLTEDGGKNWNLNVNASNLKNEKEEFVWKADIYCSVMKTSDSGLTWIPYDKERQDHFCGVYLKDNNTSYNVAGEFLNKVTTKIFLCLKNNEVGTLIDKPQQCTEYYRSPDEGWALGWCVKDFNTNKK